jgi:DNA helicase-2/ATP-dependent DNA helicase PcrA
MSFRNLELILGGPGCGKTTRLLEIVENELSNDIGPNRIAFVSFTRAAAKEAQERAATKFGFNPDDLIWFRTIHSLVYKQLGMTRSEVLDKNDWKDFGKLMGFNVTGTYSADEMVPSGPKGDQILRVVDYSATTMMGLWDAWHELDEPIDYYRLKHFDEAFRRFKSDIAKMDFTDMLLYYKDEGQRVDVDVAVIDEAQDLTAAQWAVVERAFSGAKRIYIGGDDDQAIYKWAGADVGRFLGLSGRPTVLPRSYRLPKDVYELGLRISNRISRRYEKVFNHTGRSGRVEWHQDPNFVDFERPGTWLLLARNNYMLRRFVSMMREQGFNYRMRGGDGVDSRHIEAAKNWERLRKKPEHPGLPPYEMRQICDLLEVPIPQMQDDQLYKPPMVDRPWFEVLTGITWDDREYYKSCLRKGENLNVEPRIRIETIHGVKGAEADNVLLLPDMSPLTEQGYRKNPYSEHRVFYVGITRAKENLHLIMPQSDRAYEIAGSRRY